MSNYVRMYMDSQHLHGPAMQGICAQRTLQLLKAVREYTTTQLAHVWDSTTCTDGRMLQHHMCFKHETAVELVSFLLVNHSCSGVEGGQLVPFFMFDPVW